MSLEVHAPVSGGLSSLEDAPDPIFSMGVVGWGVALDPAREAMSVVAPIEGKIERIEPHVFSIAHVRGAVMVQVGIKTDALSGEGYTVHKAIGDEVSTGEPILSWNPAEIEAKGLVPLVLVVAIGREQKELSGLEASGHAEVGDVLFTSP